MRKLIVFEILFLWITPKLIYNEAVIVKLTNAVCESYNKSLVIINQCRLRAVNRNRTTFNFNETILHPVSDISLNLQMFKKANGYKPWLFNRSIDVCQYLKKSYDPIAKFFLKFIMEFSNFNSTCPIVGIQLVQGLYIRPEYVRLPFPSGDYLFQMRWFLNKKLQILTNIYFAIQEDL